MGRLSASQKAVLAAYRPLAKKWTDSSEHGQAAQRGQSKGGAGGAGGAEALSRSAQGSWWERNKRPQLEWMLGQVRTRGR